MTKHGYVYLCSACRGRAVPIAQIRKTASDSFMRALRHKAARTQQKPRPCPLCDRTMAELDFGAKGQVVTLDVCWPCEVIWFDTAEYERVHAPQSAVRAEPPGPGDDAPSFALTAPDSPWQYLPGILGMPIELGPNRLRDRPVVTWGLAGIMAAVFCLLWMGGQRRLAAVIAEWGMIPDQWRRHGGLTLLTSFFLHAGWWHLIGNAYFLLIFGDNVEDHLGWWKFLLLLAGAHLGGMWLHSLRGGLGSVPCVGASAGISGVIAYYAIVFPRAKVGIFLWLLTFFRFLRIPAIVGLLIYAAWQIAGVYISGGGPTRVAYLAHIGGLAVGASVGVFALLLRED